MKRSSLALAAMLAIVAFTATAAQAAEPGGMPRDLRNNPAAAGPSGAYDFKDQQLGIGITECPQAGKIDEHPKPLDRRVKDEAEKVSNGNDRRVNQDYSCFPQDETALDVNPTNNKNIVAGANDYRLGFGSSGFYASTDNGKHWYDGILPFPSLPNGDNLDGGGDPAVTFDRAGVVYWSEINFNRTDDTNGVFVMRSTNGGFTWTRACVPINVGTPTDDQARCGGVGDPRKPGDGVVVFQMDNNNAADFSVTFHDKEYITSGPRPAGVTPVCFAPETKTPIPAGSPACPNDIIGVDRVYVTWTAFNNPVGTPFFITSSTIEVSYSDDQGRSWSPKKTINGGAPFCTGSFAGGTACDDNQFSVPTVNPTTGDLYVAFENFDTPDENQIVVVRSTDGGNTFAGPFFVTSQYDVNLRLRADCSARGAGRVHLTNSCFRVPGTLAVVADRRGGAFADDLYLVMWDNRNGTRDNTNGDVFFFKSLDGGSSWIGPTRVNDDPSTQPANRDCGRGAPNPACPPATTTTGNDQFWPWIDVSSKGDVNISFHDRRLDVDSVAHEWPTSRVRPGNYLVWNWGANCSVTTSSATACVAPTAGVIPQPVAPVNPSGLLPEQTVFPFGNFGISDNPSNFDYSFRAGLFAGDYNGLAIADGDNTAYAFWTDARNGRSSRTQAGRNPACEQSDVFIDGYSASGKASGQNKAAKSDELFLVTPCPTDIRDRGNRG